MDRSPQRRSPNRLVQCLGRWGSILALAAVAGCASNSSSKSTEADAPLERPELTDGEKQFAHGSLSAVVITGQPRITVKETVESVFTGAGLTVGKGTDDLWVFERRATRTESAAYGSWSGDEAKVRLKVQIVQEGTDKYLLCCRSFIARAAGTGVEDEQSLARRKVKQYEGLLYEVAARLN